MTPPGPAHPIPRDCWGLCSPFLFPAIESKFKRFRDRETKNTKSAAKIREATRHFETSTPRRSGSTKDACLCCAQNTGRSCCCFVSSALHPFAGLQLVPFSAPSPRHHPTTKPRATTRSWLACLFNIRDLGFAARRRRHPAGQRRRPDLGSWQPATGNCGVAPVAALPDDNSAGSTPSAATSRVTTTATGSVPMAIAQ